MKAIYCAEPLTVCLLLVVSTGRSAGQGSFQNLDFEAANLPTVPSGQSGGLVLSSDAIPGWTAYYGSSQTSQILHNDLSLGAIPEPNSLYLVTVAALAFLF